MSVVLFNKYRDKDFFVIDTNFIEIYKYVRISAFGVFCTVKNKVFM